MSGVSILQLHEATKIMMKSSHGTFDNYFALDASH
jgi:hypothetical protein